MESIPNYERILLALNNYITENDSVFLAGLESKDPYVVWSSIKACGLKKIEDSIDNIFNFLGEPCQSMGHTDVRRISAWSLSQFGYDKIESLIQHNILNPNPLIREGIADILGLVNDKRAIPYLTISMIDENDSVLLWAALSLSKYGNDSLDIIENHLTQDISLNKAMYLMDALHKINSKESDNLLLKFVQHCNKKEIRIFFEELMLK